MFANQEMKFVDEIANSISHTFAFGSILHLSSITSQLEGTLIVYQFQVTSDNQVLETSSSQHETRNNHKKSIIRDF